MRICSVPQLLLKVVHQLKTATKGHCKGTHSQIKRKKKLSNAQAIVKRSYTCKQEMMYLSVVYVVKFCPVIALYMIFTHNTLCTHTCTCHTSIAIQLISLFQICTLYKWYGMVECHTKYVRMWPCNNSLIYIRTHTRTCSWVPLYPMPRYNLYPTISTLILLNHIIDPQTGCLWDHFSYISHTTKYTYSSNSMPSLYTLNYRLLIHVYIQNTLYMQGKEHYINACYLCTSHMHSACVCIYAGPHQVVSQCTVTAATCQDIKQQYNKAIDESWFSQLLTNTQYPNLINCHGIVWRSRTSKDCPRNL